MIEQTIRVANAIVAVLYTAFLTLTYFYLSHTFAIVAGIWVAFMNIGLMFIYVTRIYKNLTNDGANDRYKNDY